MLMALPRELIIANALLPAFKSYKINLIGAPGAPRFAKDLERTSWGILTTNIEGLLRPTFDDLRKFAQDDSLSKYEKIGFPASYRQGKEEFIFQSIVANLPLLN